jgi:hypothetical protein
LQLPSFHSKAIKEGDGSYHCLLLLLKHKKEGDDSKVVAISPHKKMKKKGW